MDQINRHIEDGTLDQIGPLIAALRETANTHDAIMIDCLEVDVALRRADYEVALPAIRALLCPSDHIFWSDFVRADSDGRQSAAQSML